MLAAVWVLDWGSLVFSLVSSFLLFLAISARRLNDRQKFSITLKHAVESTPTSLHLPVSKRFWSIFEFKHCFPGIRTVFFFRFRLFVICFYFTSIL